VTAGNDPEVMVVDPTSSFLFAPEPFDTDIAVLALAPAAYWAPPPTFRPGPLSADGVTLLRRATVSRATSSCEYRRPHAGCGCHGVGLLVRQHHRSLTNVGGPYAVAAPVTAFPWRSPSTDGTLPVRYRLQRQHRVGISIDATSGQLQAVGTPVATGTGTAPRTSDRALGSLRVCGELL